MESLLILFGFLLGFSATAVAVSVVVLTRWDWMTNDLTDDQ